MAAFDRERGRDKVRRGGPADCAGEGEVGAPHALEVVGHLHRRFGIGVRAWLHADDDLQRRIQRVDEATETVEPLLAVVVAGAGEADRGCVDDDG